MKTNNILYNIGIIALLASSMISCHQNEGNHHEGVMEKIINESQDYKEISLSSERFNETLKKIAVKEKGHEFFIPERKSEITSYNCSECHTESIPDLKKHHKDSKAAHWNIGLNHADKETMDCKTCHTYNNMDELHTLMDHPVDFNNSYKLCSQCHQHEYKDWLGGAHGKQLGGWAPPRVSNTCVNCHNPHDPHFEKRWPVRFNSQKEKERK